MREHAAQRWVTFDCYGTLVDWKTGMADAMETVAPGRSDAVLATYHRIESDVQSERFRPYRDVLAETLARAARQEGLALDPARHHVLAETLPRWPVFADTAPALRAIRRNGWRIGILSNVDIDLIAGTLQTFPVAVDAVVTAEDVRAYKPDLAHFEHFGNRYAASSDVWIHVGCDVFHDMAPAAKLGIPHVLVDREGRYDGRQEVDRALADLTELPDVIGRLFSETRLAR